MKIERDISIEQYLLEEIQNKLINSPRSGIHISDLLSVKQAYWRKVKPLKATKVEIIYWLSGHAHESIFLNVADLAHGKAKQWEDIWYTPDVFFNFPVEIKTSRRGFVVKPGAEEKQYDHYLKQLRYYCGSENITQGWLVVWYLVMLTPDRRQTVPDYYCYRVEFTQEELDATRQEILDLKGKLIHAFETNDISNLPDCPIWMCYKETKNMIKKPYCETCKNKEFKTDYGIRSHLKGKAGRGHKVKFAVYEHVLKPACKYSQWCKPKIYDDYKVWEAKQKPADELTEESEESEEE